MMRILESIGFYESIIIIALFSVARHRHGRDHPRRAGA